MLSNYTPIARHRHVTASAQCVCAYLEPCVIQRYCLREQLPFVVGVKYRLVTSRGALTSLRLEFDYFTELKNEPLQLNTSLFFTIYFSKVFVYLQLRQMNLKKPNRVLAT